MAAVLSESERCVDATRIITRCVAAAKRSRAHEQQPPLKGDVLRADLSLAYVDDTYLQRRNKERAQRPAGRVEESLGGWNTNFVHIFRVRFEFTFFNFGRK